MLVQFLYYVTMQYFHIFHASLVCQFVYIVDRKCPTPA